MKFAYPEISGVFEVYKPYANTLVIENQKLFSALLRDIYLGICGMETGCVLSLQNTPVSMAKHCELISSFVDLDLNRKPLLNKIMAGLEEKALEPQNYTETMQLLSDIENSIDKWAFDFPCDIVSSKITVANMLKSVGLELRQEYSGINALGEKLLDYMELVREFERDKLFVLVGLRSYLPDDAAERFLNSVVAHEFHVMLIDSLDHPRLSAERRITVDEDLCEF